MTTKLTKRQAELSVNVKDSGYTVIKTNRINASVYLRLARKKGLNAWWSGTTLVLVRPEHRAPAAAEQFLRYAHYALSFQTFSWNEEQIQEYNEKLDWIVARYPELQSYLDGLETPSLRRSSVLSRPKTGAIYLSLPLNDKSKTVRVVTVGRISLPGQELSREAYVRYHVLGEREVRVSSLRYFNQFYSFAKFGTDTRAYLVYRDKTAVEVLSSQAVASRRAESLRSSYSEYDWVVRTVKLS